MHLHKSLTMRAGALLPMLALLASCATGLPRSQPAVQCAATPALDPQMRQPSDLLPLLDSASQDLPRWLKLLDAAPPPAPAASGVTTR